jgi:hypothetical protein
VKFKWNNYCSKIWDYTKEIMNYHNDNQTLWILCYTNEEVLKVAHILKKQWYHDVQIALKDTGYTLDLSLEFFDFINTFKDLNEIKREDISETLKVIEKQYWDNRNIRSLKVAIQDLLESYKKIYYSDLLDFFKWIKESDLSKKSRIIISTLHQAKWREFDSVILLFDEEYQRNRISDVDATRRLVYVGMTRAKNNLIILWKDSFSFFNELYKIIPNKEDILYDNSWESFIDLVTWLKDVVLWFNHKFDLNLNYLPLWTSLEYQMDWLYYQWKLLLKFSKKFKENLEWYTNKWYKITWARIFQRIVYPLLNEHTWERENVFLYLAILWLKK